MPNFCYVKIQASGSAKEVDQVKKLFDKHTKPCPVRDDLLTEFDRLVRKNGSENIFRMAKAYTCVSFNDGNAGRTPLAATFRYDQWIKVGGNSPQKVVDTCLV